MFQRTRLPEVTGAPQAIHVETVNGLMNEGTHLFYLFLRTMTGLRTMNRQQATPYAVSLQVHAIKSGQEKVLVG